MGKLLSFVKVGHYPAQDFFPCTAMILIQYEHHYMPAAHAARAQTEGHL